MELNHPGVPPSKLPSKFAYPRNSIRTTDDIKWIFAKCYDFSCYDYTTYIITGQGFKR